MKIAVKLPGFGIFLFFVWIQGAFAQHIPNDKVVVNTIWIEGNKRTRESIIFREMAIRALDTISRSELAEKIEVDRRKIFNTNLFVTVNINPVSFTDSSRINLVVQVKERWYFIVLPVFQLADRNFNEWWYERNRDISRTTYGVYSSFSNVTGRRDKIRALAEFGFIPKFEVSYSNPYINRKMSTGFSAGAGYITNKTMPFRTWNDKLDYFNSEQINRRRFYSFVGLSHRSKFYTWHSLSLRWNYSRLSDTLSRLNPNYFLDSAKTQQYLQLSYAYTIDRRDNVVYPLRGYHLTVQASKLGLSSLDDINQGNLYAGYSHYLPLGLRFYFNSGVRLKASLPQRQPYFQTVGFGFGQNLVRGFELYVVDGQNYALWQNEVKFKLFEFEKTLKWIPVRQFSTIPFAAYISTYFDAGHVQNKYPRLSRTSLGNRNLYGGGIGLDMVTFYNVIITLNYTKNSIGEQRFFFNISRDI